MDFWPGIAFIFRQTGNLLFSIGSHFSLTSLAAALLIATIFFVWQRLRRGRCVRVRTLLRALFPKRILHSRSNEADIGYLIFNVFVYGVMFGGRAVLPVHLQRDHFRAGDAVRSRVAINLAGRRDRSSR